MKTPSGGTTLIIPGIIRLGTRHTIQSVYNEGMTSNNTQTREAKTMSEQIKWTTKCGHLIEITFEERFGLMHCGRVKTTGRKEVVVTTEIDEEIERDWLRKVDDHPVLVARIGCIGLTQENHDRYNAAYAAVEATIADHNAECDKRAKAYYDGMDEAKKFETAMAEGDTAR